MKIFMKWRIRTRTFRFQLIFLHHWLWVNRKLRLNIYLNIQKLDKNKWINIHFFYCVIHFFFFKLMYSLINSFLHSFIHQSIYPPINQQPRSFHRQSLRQGCEGPSDDIDSSHPSHAPCRPGDCTSRHDQVI